MYKCDAVPVGGEPGPYW